MGTFSITAVHLERAPGATHDHIARVMLLNQVRDYSRAEIIYAIRAGDQFYTYALDLRRFATRGYVRDSVHPNGTRLRLLTSGRSASLYGWLV